MNISVRLWMMMLGLNTFQNPKRIASVNAIFWPNVLKNAKVIQEITAARYQAFHNFSCFHLMMIKIIPVAINTADRM
jgi:hypothetical protein